MSFFPQIDAYLEAYDKHQRINAYQRTLTADERKELAMSLGVSEADWRKTQRAYQRNLKNGHKLVSKNTYESLEKAVELYRKIEAVYPPKADVYYAVARAYRAQWKMNVEEEDVIEARRYTLAALDINPQHKKANKLLDSLDEKKVRKEKKEDRFWTGCGFAALLAIAVVVIASGYFFWNVFTSIEDPQKRMEEENTYNILDKNILLKEGVVDFRTYNDSPNFELDVFSSKFLAAKDCDFCNKYILKGYLKNNDRSYSDFHLNLKFLSENEEIVYQHREEIWDFLNEVVQKGDEIPFKIEVKFPKTIRINDIEAIKTVSVELENPKEHIIPVLNITDGHPIEIIWEIERPAGVNLKARSRIVEHYHNDEETKIDSSFVMTYYGTKLLTGLVYRVIWTDEYTREYIDEEDMDFDTELTSAPINLVEPRFLMNTPMKPNQSRLGRFTPYVDEKEGFKGKIEGSKIRIVGISLK